MSQSGRVLAVDYGEKRIGLALSDPLRIFAKPYQILENRGYESLLTSLLQISSEKEVSLILFGIPYAIEGGDTPKTEECKAVMNRLQTDLPIPLQPADERYSTSEAEDELKKLGYTWQEAKKVKDAMAACLVLKEFLSSGCQASL